jgi:Rrf2 family iron-sulfur cluster assembly transcriptional regulator
MHLTREGDYAIRVLVELAGRPRGDVVRTEDLTVITGVPRAYLAKIVQALARADLVLTRQGPGGGVSLGEDPARVTLKRMVEAIEGPIHLNRCLVRAGECPRDAFCAVHPVWAKIQAVLIRELEAVRLKDLAEATAAWQRGQILGGGRRPPSEASPQESLRRKSRRSNPTVREAPADARSQEHMHD